jgi:hypothetical protein
MASSSHRRTTSLAETRSRKMFKTPTVAITSPPWFPPLRPSPVACGTASDTREAATMNSGNAVTVDDEARNFVFNTYTSGRSFETVVRCYLQRYPNVPKKNGPREVALILWGFWASSRRDQ